MKTEITAGDTVDFIKVVSQYPPSDGWTLTYRLTPRTTGSIISFSAFDEDNNYRVQVGTSTTDDWIAGEYSWAGYVHKSGQRYTVDRGTTKILPNPLTATAYDGRSHARKVLESIEAVMENRATVDQQQYSIGGRSLVRTPMADLILLHDRYRAMVRNEDDAAKVAAGLGNSRHIYTRMNRV